MICGYQAADAVTTPLGGAMAAMSDRLSRAIPFNSLQPFDRHRFADLVPTRCCAAAYLVPVHRINHALRQVLRMRLRHLLLASAQPTDRIKISLIRESRSDPTQAQRALVR
jgi:hypothetical protein